MTTLLKTLEQRIESKVQERMGVLEPKLDEMIRILRKIEENTRK